MILCKPDRHCRWIELYLHLSWFSHRNPWFFDDFLEKSFYEKWWCYVRPQIFFRFTEGTWLGLNSSASHEGECAIRHRRETFGKRPQSGMPEVCPVVGIGGLSLHACLYPKFPFLWLREMSSRLMTSELELEAVWKKKYVLLFMSIFLCSYFYKSCTSPLWLKVKSLFLWPMLSKYCMLIII